MINNHPKLDFQSLDQDKKKLNGHNSSNPSSIICETSTSP